MTGKKMDANAYNNRGSAKYNLGDRRGAIADCDKASELNPKNAEAYRNGTYRLTDCEGDPIVKIKGFKYAKRRAIQLAIDNCDGVYMEKYISDEVPPWRHRLYVDPTGKLC